MRSAWSAFTRVTAMFEFNVAAFAKRLARLPERSVSVEPQTYSSYLKENVFDVFKQGGAIDLTKLDFDAFSFSDVTPACCQIIAARNDSGWAQSFNRFVKRVPAVSQDEAAFF